MTVVSKSGEFQFKTYGELIFYSVFMQFILRISGAIKLWDLSCGLRHVFAFQVRNHDLCMKKPMKGWQKALAWFLFLFFIVFCLLNIFWKPFFLSHYPKFQAFFAIIFNILGKTVIRLAFFSVTTIWTVKYCTKTWHFQIFISFSLSYYLFQSIFTPDFCSTVVFNCPP